MAVDFAWDAAGSGHTVTIPQGGTVTFGYHPGLSEHNADFGSTRPSSCTQTAGPSSGSVPPLPHKPTGDEWSGTCSFNQPGVYHFHCDEHPFMTGTVAVQAAGTSTTSSPLSGGANQAVRVAKTQRGTAVRGSVSVSQAGAGGTLVVTLLARGSDLGRRGAKPVAIGRISAPLHPRQVSFSVRLDATGQRALSRRQQLDVQVQVVARSPSGETVKATRAVVLRR